VFEVISDIGDSKYPKLFQTPALKTPYLPDKSHCHISDLYHDLKSQVLVAPLLFNRVKRMFGNITTSEQSPSRRFCAALISFLISTSRLVKNIEQIFTIEGFAEFLQLEVLFHITSSCCCHFDSLQLSSNNFAQILNLRTKYFSNEMKILYQF
jgi:hypothetical protein